MPARKAGSADKRIAGRKLQALRSRLLRANPLCVLCQRDGRVSVATVLDHVVALTNGGDYSDANMQGLCKPCHELKTRQDLGQRVRYGCDASGAPLDPSHHWNR
jgi:5-methylcytosine-specific restriction protein A